jgi:uncharacterized SAM-binding protein YcdF (DUF218 family)
MFLFSKIVGAAADPSNLMLAAYAAAAGLLFTRWWKWGRAVAAGTTMALLAVTLTPVDHWLLGTLENRFPPQPPPAQVDGIVVLGGAINPILSAARGAPALTAAADRFTAMLILARRYPKARVIYSGGSGNPFDQTDREAPQVRRLVSELGLSPRRFIFEGQSRNTHENALFSKRLAHPHPGETWLLVTSALHMPRAVGAFRAVGWPVTPYPVNYRTMPSPPSFLRLDDDVADHLERLAAFTHEVVGLAGYRFLGWTNSLFPGPTSP